MSDKKLLFSVTASDCRWAYTRGTGAGGQKRNKTSSAAHCFHDPSGAHGYAEDSRSQLDNRRLAFQRMAESKQFKDWHQLEVARRTGELASIEAKVEAELKRVKVEGKDGEGRWIELK